MSDTPSVKPTEASASFSLRQLPLPARLTLTAFLLSVGLGYFSALVQLHFKHASPGNPMPTVNDVVAHFSGVDWDEFQGKKPDEEPQAKPEAVVAAAAVAAGDKVPAVKIKSLIDLRCATCHKPGEEKEEYPLHSYEALSKYIKPTPTDGQLHKVLVGDPKKWSKSTMVRAFTDKSPTWEEDLANKPEPQLREERETERLAMIAWVEAGSPENAYHADAFPLPTALATAKLTVELQTHALATKAEASAAASPPAKKKKSAKSKQTSVEALTQSTHVHALGFSVLYVLTGLAFALTTFPVWFRCIIAPMTVVAATLDVSCWWLARLDGIGPYFAVCILATGGAVGLSLALQIVLTVFNMFGWRGNALLVVMFMAAAGGFGVLWMQVLNPVIVKEQQEELKRKEAESAAEKEKLAAADPVKLKAEADRKAKAEAEKARAEADRKSKEEAARKAAAQAEIQSLIDQSLAADREKAAADREKAAAVQKSLSELVEAWKKQESALSTQIKTLTERLQKTESELNDSLKKLRSSLDEQIKATQSAQTQLKASQDAEAKAKSEIEAQRQRLLKAEERATEDAKALAQSKAALAEMQSKARTEAELQRKQMLALESQLRKDREAADARIAQLVKELRQLEAKAAAVASSNPALVPAGAKFEKLWSEGEFTEGPALAPDGQILFSDIGNRILAFNPSTGKTSVYREPSGRANGLAFDSQGRLIACEGANTGGNRRLSRTENGQVITLAERWEGRRFNSPNDLTIANNGDIYFSDPRYVGDEKREIDVEAVYRVSKNGVVTQLISDVVKPNGLALSPDEKTLYIADTPPAPNAKRQLLAYELRPDGTVGPKRVLHDFGAVRGIDGMKTDLAGRIWATVGDKEFSRIDVFSPDGKLLASYPVPETPSNCCFAGSVLYVTAGKSLYRILTNTSGRR